eukprot:815123_1
MHPILQNRIAFNRMRTTKPSPLPQHMCITSTNLLNSRFLYQIRVSYDGQRDDEPNHHHNTCASQAQPISSFPLSSDEQDTTDATNPLNATIELTIFIQSIPYHEINATHAHAPIVQKKNNITNRQHTHYQPDRNHE